jgi:hypothetical protein
LIRYPVVDFGEAQSALVNIAKIHYGVYNKVVLNKHFFKTLTVFTAMIAVGLIGVLLLSFFE